MRDAVTASSLPRQPVALVALDPDTLVDLIRDAVRSAVAEALAALPAERSADPNQPMALSEKDAAERLGMTVAQLGTQRRMGRIKATRVGRRVRYTPEQLRKFLADGARKN